MNEAMKKALKALSYPDIQVKKNYKAIRKLEVLFHPRLPEKFYKTWDQKIVLGDHEIPVRIFSRNYDAVKPILVFFHGGGWVIGNIDSYNNVCANLVKYTDHTVVSVDYRLAPEFKFPAAVEDCYKVTREVYMNSQDFFGIDSHEITIIGDSAGGNLAAAVSLMARDRGEFMPSRQILFYPAVGNDFTDNTPYRSIVELGQDYLLTQKRMCDYMDLYQNSPEDRNNPYFAPIISEDLSCQPKTLIITAEFDPLRDEGEAYANKLEAFGNDVELVRVPDVLHGFFSLSPRYGPVKECYERVRCFCTGETYGKKE